MATLDTSCLDRLSAEAEVPRKEVAVVLKGFERYLAQDIDPESREQLQELVKRYRKRLAIADNAKVKGAEYKAAIEALIADGHPEEPGSIVDKSVIEDLDENLDTLIAARRRFTPRPITTGGRLVIGPQVRIT